MARSAKPKLSRGEASSPLVGSELDRRLRSFAVELDYVYRSLRRHGVGATDAEDLAQEVFLIAWRRRADFDHSRRLRPWLAGIAFKLAHQHHRRRHREVLADGPFDPEPAAEPTPDALETRALVLRVLANLPERHRSVLVLHELDGLSVEDICSLWDVPRFTLYTRLRRARHAFVREVTRLQEPGSARRPASAAALLALERPVPPVPSALRARVFKRLKKEAAIPALSEPPPAPPLPARLIPVLGASACLCLTVGLLALLLSRPSGAAPPQPGRGAERSEMVLRSLGRSSLPPARLLIADGIGAGRTEPDVAADLGRELTGFWPFDDGPGSTVAADLSAGGHVCQLRDLDPVQAWIPGVRGGAVELGFNGWLECPQPEAPRSSVALTVAVWVKRGGNPPWHRALAMRPMGKGPGNYFFFGFAGDQLSAFSSVWGGALHTPFQAPPGRWVHVAFTHDAGHVLRLYIDGVEVARRKTSPRRVNAAREMLQVGAGRNGPERRIGQRFEGALDELRVYERALPEAEIRALAAR